MSNTLGEKSISGVSPYNQSGKSCECDGCQRAVMKLKEDGNHTLADLDPVRRTKKYLLDQIEHVADETFTQVAFPGYPKLHGDFFYHVVVSITGLKLPSTGAEAELKDFAVTRTRKVIIDLLERCAMCGPIVGWGISWIDSSRPSKCILAAFNKWFNLDWAALYITVTPLGTIKSVWIANIPTCVVDDTATNEGCSVPQLFKRKAVFRCEERAVPTWPPIPSKLNQDWELDGGVEVIKVCSLATPPGVDPFDVYTLAYTGKAKSQRLLEQQRRWSLERRETFSRNRPFCCYDNAMTAEEKLVLDLKVGMYIPCLSDERRMALAMRLWLLQAGRRLKYDKETVVLGSTGVPTACQTGPDKRTEDFTIAVYAPGSRRKHLQALREEAERVKDFMACATTRLGSKCIDKERELVNNLWRQKYEPQW